MGWVVSATPMLYPREWAGTHCTGGWMDTRSGLDECGNSRFPTHSVVGIPTTLLRPKKHKLNTIKLESKSGYNRTTQVYSLTATPPGSVEQFTV